MRSAFTLEVMFTNTPSDSLSQ